MRIGSVPRALSSLVVAAAAALGLAGCSGDADPPPEPTTSASVVAETSRPVSTADLAALFTGNSTEELDRRQGRCFARALQRRLDFFELEAGGIVDSQGDVVEVLPVFDEVTAAAWVDAQLACVDYVEASLRALLTQTRGGLDAEAYAACLRDALTEAEIQAALELTLSGGFDSPEVAALADAQASCAE